MEAAARGAKSVGGLTIGILPGVDADDANEFIDIPMPTGLGYARNVVNVLAGDAVVAVAGSYGTLSEIAHALSFGIPVVAVSSWADVEGVIHAGTPEDAVDAAFDLAGARGR
jgi:uncharacterized protein (TIGR00725 family)